MTLNTAPKNIKFPDYQKFLHRDLQLTVLLFVTLTCLTAYLKKIHIEANWFLLILAVPYYFLIIIVMFFFFW